MCQCIQATPRSSLSDLCERNFKEGQRRLIEFILVFIEGKIDLQHELFSSPRWSRPRRLSPRQQPTWLRVFLVLPLQIVLHREEEVLECECDMAMVHHLLSQIPQDLPYETLVSRAGDLFVQFPPSELAREAASHDRYSTLSGFHLRLLQMCITFLLLLNSSGSLFFHFLSLSPPKAWRPLPLRTLTLRPLNSDRTLSSVAVGDRNRPRWSARQRTR